MVQLPLSVISFHVLLSTPHNLVITMSGSGKVRAYKALIEQTDGALRCTPLDDAPSSAKELKVKIKADRAALRENQKTLREMKRQSDEKKRFKRASWEIADQLDVLYQGVVKKIDAMLTDPWSAIKESAMEVHELEGKPDDYNIELRYRPPMNKKVKGKSVEAKFGEINPWEGSLVLSKAAPPSSSDAAAPSTSSDVAAPSASLDSSSSSDDS